MYPLVCIQAEIAEKKFSKCAMNKSEHCKIMCSIERAIETIGDSWSLLIIRDLGQGLSHFEDFKNNLSIAPAVLSKRLAGLVQQGLVRKEIYQTNPPRAKYVLTDSGKDFLPVLASLMVWGNKYCSPNGIDSELVDAKTHKKITPLFVDAKTGKAIDFSKTVYSGGPANSPEKAKLYKERGLPVVPAE